MLQLFLGFKDIVNFGVHDTATDLILNQISVLVVFKYQMTVFLYSSKPYKTDPFRYGITIPLFKNSSDICPVAVLKKYCGLRMSI